MKNFALVLLCLFTSLTVFAKTVVDNSGYAYDPADTSCDGYPRLQVTTMPGTCLGMVISQSKVKVGKKSLFVMPRSILQIPGTDDFLLTDMGGWTANNGSLYWLKKGANGYEVGIVKTKLNMAHGIELDENGFIYLGENQRITRFHFKNGIVDEELVIGNLPANKGDMHPLTQMTFSPLNNDMYINSGAPTDHCSAVKGVACGEAEAPDAGASILRLAGNEMEKPLAKGVIARPTEVTAVGLRNSMAMVVSHDGRFLIQGENSRDFPEMEEPYEEMNLVPLANNSNDYHYGWPYCYDFNAQSPEWLAPENSHSPIHAEHGEAPFDCSKNSPSYMRPISLIPPHAAPLHAGYYNGAMFKNILGGKLLMAWHGYRETGHRLVAYDVDANGIPILKTAGAGKKFGKEFTYNVDQRSGCPKPTPFNPRGGFDSHATYIEVISGWYEMKGVRPRGAPTSFTVANDGSVWIVEDKNKTVVRLAKTDVNPKDSCLSDKSDEVDPNIELLAWRNVLKNDPALLANYDYVRDQLFPSSKESPTHGQGYCMGCHNNFRDTDLKGSEDHFTFMDFLVRSQWLKPQSGATSPIVYAVKQTGEYPPMPPTGNPQLLDKSNVEGPKIISSLENWITSLPADISKRYAKVTMRSGFRIRQAPSVNATICGQFVAGDIAYVDPRPSTRMTADGNVWSKVYMVPDHTRLFYNACAYPDDGVFYTVYP